MKRVEEWRVESSAYEWIGLDEQLRRSLIKSKNRVGDKTEPCGTPLLTGKEEEVAPSTTAEMERLERKLDTSKQREGGNPKEGELGKQ